jgi:GNAT superfamily N-acetyltransferase
VKVALSAPEPIGTHHQIGEFSSGVVSLDEWLKRRALANQAGGAARTFVVCEADKVIGYYALASGAVTGRFRRNIPGPIPVVVLARLAVDRAYQGHGLGRAMFRDAARRVVHAAETIGIRGIIVHAISDNARAFYRALGFESSPIEPMTLVVTLADIRKSLA